MEVCVACDGPSQFFCPSRAYPNKIRAKMTWVNVVHRHSSRRNVSGDAENAGIENAHQKTGGKIWQALNG